MGTLTLSGAVFWDQATALKDTLVREAAADGRAVLDLSGLEKTDTGIVQLLLSMQESCRRRGKTLELKGPLRPEVRELLKDLGFTPQAFGEWAI